MGYVKDAILDLLNQEDCQYDLLPETQCDALWQKIQTRFGFASGYCTNQPGVDEYRFRCDRVDTLIGTVIPRSAHVLFVEDEGSVFAIRLNDRAHTANLVGEMFDFCFAITSEYAEYVIAFDDHGSIQGLGPAAQWLRETKTRDRDGSE
jgi:hypothetical protein